MHCIIYLVVIGLLFSCNNQPDYAKIYEEWAKQTNASSDEFCTPKECEEKAKEPLKSVCDMRLSEKFATATTILTDLNQDGIKDAIVKSNLESCMAGTWFINVAAGGYWVVFLSKGNGEIEILEEPKGLLEAVGVGFIKEANGNQLIIEGGAINGNGDTIHDVDQKWLATVNFTDGHFVVLDKKEQAVD